MTRTISLITAVAGVALIVAVPALGQSQQDFWNYDRSGQKVTNTSPGVSPQGLGSLYSGSGSELRSPLLRPDAVDRAVAAREAQQAARPYPDVVERAVAAKMTEGRSLVFDNHRSEVGDRTGQQLGGVIQPDAFERAVASRNTAGRSLVFDNHRIGIEPSSAGSTLVFDNYRTDPVSPPTEIVATGRDLEWPQIGAGLGIGIALMLGLFLTLRLVRVRPLAH